MRSLLMQVEAPRVVEAARGPKIEVTSKEAWAAVIFVFMVMVVVAMIQAGIITNVMTAGIIVTLATLLILVGHYLVSKGIFSRGILPVWYVFVLGLILLIAGGILTGKVMPAFVISGATVLEIAIANALFYTLIVVAVIGAFAAYYFYTKKFKA